MIYTISIWLLPAIIAITFHEAAHAFVARANGDDTASRLGRVSFNPLKHIDPVGTILLPGILLLAHSPFLFGYAKPVPVNFRALHNPRRDMVLVAAAGPATNIALAVLAALGFHLLGYLPANIVQWVAENLKNAIILNVGRIAVGLLPNVLAFPLSRLEPYGMTILIGVIIVLPLLGSQTGIDLSFVSHLISSCTETAITLILKLTGNLPITAGSSS
jgi:Zn-dependent protease